MSSSVERRDGWNISSPAKNCLCTSAENSEDRDIVETEGEGKSEWRRGWENGKDIQVNAAAETASRTRPTEQFKKRSFGRMAQGNYRIGESLNGWMSLKR